MQTLLPLSEANDMTNYARTVRAGLAPLAAIFSGPPNPLITGPRGPAPVRYDRNTSDSRVYLAQLSAIERVPHRILRGPEIQLYVDQVMAMPWPRWRQGAQWGVTVNVMFDATFALYRSGVITVPGAVQEPVVLHEIAHHFAPVPTGPHGTRSPGHHGPAFVAAYLDLIEHVMNEEAANVFRQCFVAEGISVQ